MGCLNVSILKRVTGDLKVGISNQNRVEAFITGLRASVLQMVSSARGMCIRAVSAFSRRALTFGNKNTTPHLRVVTSSASLSLHVALVCTVGLDGFQYFYVTDEPFVVSNGYFLVQRSKG